MPAEVFLTHQKFSPAWDSSPWLVPYTLVNWLGADQAAPEDQASSILHS